jgi:hypothetical protein
MIDNLIIAPDEATAIADPVLSAYYRPGGNGPNGAMPGSWGPNCIAGILAWNPADDVTSSVSGPDGQSIPVVTHTYLPGFGLWIMTDAPVDALDNHPMMRVSADGDLLLEGKTPAEFIRKSALPVDQITKLRLSAVPLGRDYSVWFGT